VVRTLCGTDFKYINANLVIKKIEQFILTITNVPVSETIRKPPLVKPKLHFKKTKNKIWRKTIFNMADWIISLHPAMWHVILESWQWIYQVAAVCNVIRGSGMTCHGIRPNVRHIGILHLVSILTISPQSTCHSAPVCEILSKSDHHQQKKWRRVDFQDGGLSHLGFLGSNNGFFESK